MRIFVAFILTALLLFFSCQSPEKNDKSILTATLKGPSAMAMIRMIENKPVIGEQYKTVFEIKNEPSLVKAMIMEGTADFAIVPTTMAALLYNKGAAYQLAAIPVWGTLYLCGSDTSIHSWTDLIGKRVSLMEKGNTPDVLFRHLAIANGINPDEQLKADYSFPGHIELANAIAAGISDLGVISEPMVSIIRQKNTDIHTLMDLNLEWEKRYGDTIPLAQTALLVKKEFAEMHPDLVDSYLEKLEESINWVNQYPAAAAGLIKKYEILPDSALAVTSIPLSNIKFASASEEKSGIQEYLKVFYTFNPLIIGGKLPDEEFYYQKPAH